MNTWDGMCHPIHVYPRIDTGMLGGDQVSTEIHKNAASKQNHFSLYHKHSRVNLEVFRKHILHTGIGIAGSQDCVSASQLV